MAALSQYGEEPDRVISRETTHLYECNACGHQTEHSTEFYDDGERRQCDECNWIADHHYLGEREVVRYVDDDHPGYLECERHGRFRADEEMCPDCWSNMQVMNDGW